MLLLRVVQRYYHKYLNAERRLHKLKKFQLFHIVLLDTTDGPASVEVLSAEIICVEVLSVEIIWLPFWCPDSEYHLVFQHSVQTCLVNYHQEAVNGQWFTYSAASL